MGAPIAIVGIACHYPDAATPDELFENALAGRRAFRRIPDERLPLSEYGSSDPGDVDATYLTQAALIEGYQFDRLRFKTVGSTYRSADLTHWLALDVADRALRDAGFSDGEGLPRETTGVLLGNTLTGEFSRAQAMRLRWPYVEALLAEALGEVLPAESDREEFLAAFEARYKAPFEPFGDESLAGGLSNTIAGRICNYFDLGGGGFTVDGACASSLLAVANACNALQSSDLDVALAGGVDISLDPFELVGFSRAGALAPNEMRVYEQRSEGFWPGEGCGFLVLMREADAVAQSRRIHARIRGWGISSDGAGGISRPEESGQLLAMRRAYARAGFGPETVGYFEGHGTGTVVGDTTELGALNALLREASRASGGLRDPIPIGSIKANIGHTKAAAGVAGLIVAAMAVRQQVVPGMPSCERPHERVDPGRGALLTVPRRAEVWSPERELRAGVSSMGFGGINAHVVVDAAASSRRAALSARERELASTAQDAEVFLLGAVSRAALRERVDALRARVGGLSRAELTDLSVDLAEACAAFPVRAAVVASRPDELGVRLETLRSWLERDDEAQPARISATRGIFLGSGREPPSIGFLFPGQGAPVHAGLGAIGDRFPEARARDAVSRYGAAAIASRGGHEHAVVDTRVAQPAIVAASLAGAEVLGALGIHARVAVGHSLGEISALCWAGALRIEEAVALAEERGRIMSEFAEPGGCMASLPVSPEQARVLIKRDSCTLAGHNGPKRCVISGAEDAIERVLARAREEGVRAARLSVSHAFHSPLVAPCADPLRRALGSFPFRRPEREVVSTRTGTALDPGDDLASHLVAQLTEPVRFADAAEEADRRVDLLIEVGPGRMLSGLAREFLSAPAIPLETGSDSVRGLLSAVAAAYVLGVPIDRARIFEGRSAKPLDWTSPPKLFANPAARPLAERAGTPARTAPGRPPAAGTGGRRCALDVVIELVADRCELPPQAVEGTDRFLSDLHMTSIAVSTIASEAARALGRPPLVAPNEFADATLAELALAIDSEDRVMTSAQGVPGVDAWLRAFEVLSLERPRPRAAAAAEARARSSERFVWRGFGPPRDGFLQELLPTFEREVAPGGVLVHLPDRDAEANLPLLLAAAKAAVEDIDARLFVLVHHDDAGVSLVRALHQEARSLASRVVCVPEGHVEAAAWVVAEAKAAAGYLECSYDEAGRRCERRLRPLPVTPGTSAPLPLGEGEVLLVSGGGKGIAAECALALARETGCRLGIIGRSAPESDAELAANLARFRDAGVQVCYAAADVTDHEAVACAVDEVEAALGPVRALLHGAGLNTPCSLVALDHADFARTLAPKVQGWVNLLDRLESNALRCVVGFGSVIAQLGLPGEADYAWANELLSRRIECFAEAHPETRCLSIEWSIWSGVGMGERLGRVETLAAMNIAAIGPEAGVAWLLELLRRSDVPVRVFLSGRFGSPPTLAVEERELPVGRFLERVREYTPGVELVADAEISFESDPYVADHVYRGDAILPGVMGLEAMAQIAGALVGTGDPPVFENVEFRQALEVPPGGKRGVRIAALVRAPGTVELAIRSDASDFVVDHLRAVALFPDRAAERVARVEALEASGPGPALDPASELYGDLFFHRGRFQRVRSYRRLGSRGCEVEIARRDERFFGAFQPRRLWLGDAGARDAAIHAIQACIPERDLLPVGVERIETTRLRGEEPVLLRARERIRGSGAYVYDLEILDLEGTHLERWRGLALREVAGATQRRSWPAGLLGPRLEELAREHFADAELRAAVVPGADRAASERAAAVASGAACRLAHRPDGKPSLGPSACGGRAGTVSTSHAGGHTLAVAGAEGVACDMEEVLPRDTATWSDLLGPERERLARHVARVSGEDYDTSATRLWGVRECLAKQGVQRDAPVVLVSEPRAGALRLATGELAIVSVAAEVQGVPHPVVITLLARGSDARL